MKSQLYTLFPLFHYFNIPVTITLLGILMSLMSLFFLLNHMIHWAVIFILLAIIMDQLDGLAARKLNKITAFGGYLDVFGDFIAYCLFPIVTIYSFVAHSLPILLISLLFFLAGTMRLAHYMTSATKDIVIGIPCCLLIIALPYLNALTTDVLQTSFIFYSIFSCGVFFSSLNFQRNSFLGKSLMALLFVTGMKEIAQLFCQWLSINPL